MKGAINIKDIEFCNKDNQVLVPGEIWIAPLGGIYITMKNDVTGMRTNYRIGEFKTSQLEMLKLNSGEPLGFDQ